MVQAFDHRAAGITNQTGNLFRPGQPDRTLDDEHRDPNFSPRPLHWINQRVNTLTQSLHYFLAFKEITASTNVRTMIATVVPQVGCIDTLPVLLPLNDRFKRFRRGVYSCQSEQLLFGLHRSSKNTSNSHKAVYA